jgi:hypothetical protein
MFDRLRLVSISAWCHAHLFTNGLVISFKMLRWVSIIVCIWCLKCLRLAHMCIHVWRSA